MIIKVFSDKEKVRSILKMAEESEGSIRELFDFDIMRKHQSMAAKGYYDVIRSLATGLLLCKGFKAIGENAHKETINFLLNFEGISAAEVEKVQDLRVKRNKSSYEGKSIESPYLENNKQRLDLIISKLKGILVKELKNA